MRIFDWTRAEELYRHGASDCTIAQTLGCSVSSVWRWRYKYELFPNGRKGRPKGGTHENQGTGRAVQQG